MSPIAKIQELAEGKGGVISVTTIVMLLLTFAFEQNQQIADLTDRVEEIEIQVTATKRWISQSDNKNAVISMSYNMDIEALKSLHGLDHTPINLANTATYYELEYQLRSGHH